MQGQPRSVGSGTLVSESWGGRVTPFQTCTRPWELLQEEERWMPSASRIPDRRIWSLLNPMGHELIVHGQLGSCYLGGLLAQPMPEGPNSNCPNSFCQQCHPLCLPSLRESPWIPLSCPPYPLQPPRFHSAHSATYPKAPAAARAALSRLLSAALRVSAPGQAATVMDTVLSQPQ